MPGRQKRATLSVTRQDSDAPEFSDEANRADHIVERGGKFLLMSKKHPGKVLGEHDTRAGAEEQERAILANQHQDDFEVGPLTGALQPGEKTREPGQDVAPNPQGTATYTKVDRIDVFRLDAAAERTPQGGLRVPANLTRSGVFNYRNQDGSLRREYRPPAQVFDAASLKSLEDATVTDLHQGMVTPANYASLSKGHVRDVKRAGTFVSGAVLVQDAGAVAAVEAGTRKELSCGYSCDLDPTPGRTDAGEEYDAVQTNIRYNHVALLPVGEGRAGREVALRLDGAAYSCHDLGADLAIARTEPGQMKIRFDGKEYEAGSKEHLDATDAFYAKAQADLARVTAERDQAIRDRDSARADAADARDPAKLAARVAARAQLEADAKRLWPEVKSDGLTDAQVREAVVLHGDDAVKARLDSFLVDGKSGPAHEAYVTARFDAMLAGAGKSAAGAARAAIVTSEFTYDAAAISAANAGATAPKPPWQQDLSSHA